MWSALISLLRIVLGFLPHSSPQTKAAESQAKGESHAAEQLEQSQDQAQQLRRANARDAARLADDVAADPSGMRKQSSDVDAAIRRANSEVR